MQCTALKTLVNTVLKTLMGSLLCASLAWAAAPLWTMVPTSGSNPNQTLADNSQVEVSYLVENQSSKPKKLVIQAIAGISQTTTCALTAKGQAGSSCILRLVINGSNLSPNGVHGGPALCQSNEDSSPNLNQCYQPSQANALNITKLASTLSISLTGSPLVLFPAYPNLNGISKSLTITNTSTSTITNIAATLPADWVDVTQDASNCVSLLPGASCQLIFTPSTTLHTPIIAPVQGTNSEAVNAGLAVDSPWITDAAVLAIATDLAKQVIYLGGTFSRVGPNTGQGVPIDEISGAPLAQFPRVNGFVSAAIADGTGGWYIGGDFTSVGGLTRNRIAHILADYTVDTQFNPNANGDVRALAIYGNTVFAGGIFTLINNQSHLRLAAIDAATGIPIAWNLDANSTVNALAINGSTVYAGGAFTTISGQTRNRLAAINATDGTLSNTWTPEANSVVFALVVDNNIVYAGGNFTTITINGIANLRTRLAAINVSDGSLSTTWTPSAGNTVIALAVYGNIIYVGGNFTTINSQTRNRLAAIDLATGTLLPWNPQANNVVDTLAINGSTVYAGGNFTTIGSETRNRLAAIDADTGIPSSWNPDASQRVFALAINGSTVYAGGSFVTMGGVNRNSLAAIDAATGTPTSWDPNASNRVTALAVSVDGSIVYAGGEFLTMGSENRMRIAAIDASDGTPISTWINDANNSVTALALSVDGSILYVGGDFSTINSQTRSRIAAINATDGTLSNIWIPSANSRVAAIVVNNNIVYLGGSFGTINSQTLNYLAAINATDGTLITTWNPNPNNPVNALALSVDGSTVYAGGIFGLMGSTQRNRLAAIDAFTGMLTPWDPNANGAVRALAVNGNTVYAGGDFTTLNLTLTRNRLAAINASTGMPTLWDPNASGNVSALAVNGSTVYAGGGFRTVGNQFSPSFALLTEERYK